MVDFILEKFTEIASKCLEKNAKENKTEKKNMQLVFKLGADGETEYVIYKDFAPLKSVTFLQVLGVKLDFKGYSIFVPKFIKGALERFCEEFDMAKEDARVVLNFHDNESMVMWLYNASTYIKQVELESLFDNQDILEQ
jgi:hypothetical protein